MTERYRQRVVRADGRAIQLVQRRAHLSYCFSGCCCGRTERGYAAVPVDTYKDEWIRRRLRNSVHLTKAGCLGPCSLANVASLVFDGRAVWFHSVNTPWHVRLLFDHIEAMIRADRFLPPPAELTEYVFNFYDWDARPRAAPEPTLPDVSPDVASIALLSHADTDVLALNRLQDRLPPGLVAAGLSLCSIHSPEQMDVVLDGALAAVRIVVVRVHGEPKGIPGLARLQSRCRDRGRHLLLVSGTGTLSPELAEAGTAPLDVLATTTSYLSHGGPHNIAECLKFLADRLLLTGFGYEAPRPVARHGIYLADLETATFGDWTRRADPTRPTAAVLFYAAHLLSGNTAFIDTLVDALEARGLNALPVFTSGLREVEEGVSAALRLIDGRADVVLSTLSFALGELNAGGVTAAGAAVHTLERIGVPFVQAIASGSARASWEVSRRGLPPLDTAINIAIPELDGRIIGVPVSFKDRSGGDLYEAHPERADRLAGLAARLAHLKRTPPGAKRVAFVLTNSAAKASRVGNAVGLDAPASLLNLLRALTSRGYALPALPETSDELMETLLARGSYDETHPLDPAQALRYSRARYKAAFDTLPEPMRRRLEEWWGTPVAHGYTRRTSGRKIDKKIAPGLLGTLAVPDEEPWSDADSYLFAAWELENVVIALQPPRGYGVDPDAIYHTPDLPPTHHYVAFHRWLAASRADGGWAADAIVHVGKHGTLEWLPGKGVGLSADCFPDALLTDLPLVYPFILNDPGEGSQAKRRAHAVVVDHLMPAMTNAETYGPLSALSELVNEYYLMEKLDPSKLPLLQQQIWELIQETNLHTDLRARMGRDHGDHKHEWDDELTPEGVPLTLSEMGGNEVAHLIEDLDGYLCELGLAQIRDGLHVLGEMPPLPDTLRALTRLPNAGVPGLQEALARAYGFDLGELLARPGARLEAPSFVRNVECLTHRDVLERLDALTHELFGALEEAGFQDAQVPVAQTATLGLVSTDVSAVLAFAGRTLVPALEQVTDEIDHVLDALDGRYVPAGPAGAPTRGMAHVLPTGRNFYAVDPRAVPSQAAWRVGQQLAREVLQRHLKEEGRHPEMIGIGAWGTSQMRTQGDDIAQVLALLGVEPVWDPRSRRLQGVRVVPLETLGRPRIDVTLRISGFFRDAFPHLIDLVDEAIERVVALDEPLEQNFPRKHYLAELEANGDAGIDEAEARARYRIFGAKPGTYGAGLQALMDSGHWQTDADLARVFVEWGGYAYGRDADGVDARGLFTERLRAVEIAVHNQDNREHDIFDSDDYYQFHGGMIASVRALTGRAPRAYFGDSSRPDDARVRDLAEESLRVYRARVVNPKWLESMKRHGYKGGLELAATVDYIFGFDATAHVAPDFVYEGLAEAYALAPEMQEFLRRANPWALHAIAERLLEAARRGLWEKPSETTLEALRGVLVESEASVEARGERVRETR
jgi:cobaltochelatase CobN